MFYWIVIFRCYENCHVVEMLPPKLLCLGNQMAILSRAYRWMGRLNNPKLLSLCYKLVWSFCVAAALLLSATIHNHPISVLFTGHARLPHRQHSGEIRNLHNFWEAISSQVKCFSIFMKITRGGVVSEMGLSENRLPQI